MIFTPISFQEKKTMSLKVLVIGGVACGPKAASRLKRLCPDADITIIEKGSLISYGACGLPYFIEGVFQDVDEVVKTPAGVLRTTAFFEKVKGVRFLTGTEALAIDRPAKKVRVRNLETGAEEDMAYDRLVLATGGHAFHPPIPGLDLKNVWFITHPDHAAGLKKSIVSRGLKKAVLAGAGFIGMEMAEALIRQGLEVTLVEMCDHIMPGVLDEDMALIAARHLRQKGVNIVLEQKVVGLEGDRDVKAVITDRQRMGADLVVVAAGFRPNDKLAREAELSCSEAGGIIIDDYCRTSDPDIYGGAIAF